MFSCLSFLLPKAALESLMCIPAITEAKCDVSSLLTVAICSPIGEVKPPQ